VLAISRSEGFKYPPVKVGINRLEAEVGMNRLGVKTEVKTTDSTKTISSKYDTNVLINTEQT
jgi:hypothetical protein